MIHNSNNSKEASYGQILRSSAILGGAQGMIYIILIIRTKIVAVLLGTAGMGTFGLYQSVISFVATISNLGIATSGVQAIADAEQSDDAERSALIAQTVEKISWVTGILGWLLMIAFAYPLCVFTFGTSEHIWAISIVGITLLFSAVAGGHSAILQGKRKIGDLARYQLISTAITVAISLPLFAWLGHSGIIPAIILGAIVSCTTAWWFTSRIKRPEVPLEWPVVYKLSRRMIGLGVAFMWNAVITLGVALATRALIVRNLGLEASGIYQAAWGLSGMFAGFILTAMGTDFFPRLTSVASDPSELTRLVNEQTEIGILLSMPGLIFTLALAPWLMRIFYSPAFAAGGEMLPWFVLGVFGQVISWPMGFVQMAKGASKAYIVTQTLFNGMHLALTVVMLQRYGLVGISFAFPILYAIYSVGMRIYCGATIGFRWSPMVIRLVILATSGVGLCFALNVTASPIVALVGQISLGMAAGLVSLRGLAARLGDEHRIRKFLSRVPGMKFAESFI